MRKTGGNGGTIMPTSNVSNTGGSQLAIQEGEGHEKGTYTFFSDRILLRRAWSLSAAAPADDVTAIGDK